MIRISPQIHIPIYLLFLIPFLLIMPQATAQDPVTDSSEHEAYYTDFSDQLIIRLYPMYKSNALTVKKDDKTMQYNPNGSTTIGVGFNYKWLGLGISFGFPVSQKRIDKYGNTRRLDVQMSLYSKNFGLDGFFQIYRGYYNSNPNDFIEWNNGYYPKLPDMSILSLGVNAFYILQGKKFSYRAAFVRNEIQNKSAGSVVVGLFGTYDAAVTDNGFVPTEYPDSIKQQFDLKSFEAFTIGVTAGYMYTFVIGKYFFINLAAVPGVGYRRYTQEDAQKQVQYGNKAAFHFTGRTAFAYDNTSFFINLTFSYNLRNYEYKSYRMELSSEQLRLTFGKRFVVGKNRKKKK